MSSDCVLGVSNMHCFSKLSESQRLSSKGLNGTINIKWRER